jgi:hypothetical protein
MIGSVPLSKRKRIREPILSQNLGAHGTALPQHQSLLLQQCRVQHSAFELYSPTLREAAYLFAPPSRCAEFNPLE